MKASVIFLLSYFIFFVNGNSIRIYEDDKEEKRLQSIIDLIMFNSKSNGWTNVIISVTNGLQYSFYMKLRRLPLTTTVLKPGESEHIFEDVVPYHSNLIILECNDFTTFEISFLKIMESPYWHAHAQIIIYFHAKEKDEIPKIFMIFWFFKACNAIIVQYDDLQERLLVSQYNPYISEGFRLPEEFGCWKVTKVGRLISKLSKGFACVKGCQNITLHSKLRVLHLGTCIGIKTDVVRYGDNDTLSKTDFFEDKGRNLHGIVLRAHATQAPPFTTVEMYDNGTYSLRSRDGMIWITAAKFMNFSIDLSASKEHLKKAFNFQSNIQQVYTFAQGQADILIFPVYLFDIIIVEVDMSIPYRDSGVCIVSHRADYETILFDVKLLEKNMNLFVRFLLCFLCIWLMFFIFNIAETNTLTLDLAGESFQNTLRSVLSISLHKPPQQGSFRIYLGISIWCFFIINFSTQAAITSFFTAYSRGKEVDTFDDVIEKDYPLEGMASPDMILPDTEERFRKVNSKLVVLGFMYLCVDRMANDSRRFCLMDCSVARYLENNKLNAKGEQYLHVATKDQIHSHYLTMALHKNSPLTRTFNKFLRMCFEAGLIKKWEQYRFSCLKSEVPIKALSMDDLIGIFKCHYLVLGFSAAVFFLEIVIWWLQRLKKYIGNKFSEIMKNRRIKNKQKLERKKGKTTLVNAFTQTA